MTTPIHRPSFPWNRRRFLKTASLAAGAAAFGVPTLLRARNLNNKLNIAGIGCGGKGETDIAACAGENIVALCDVDSDSSAKQLKKFPSAKVFNEFRKMFDEMESGIDAVLVSTPDHCHAMAASRAMRLGRHVYCQKPLTQTIYEARYLRDLAQHAGLVTQMGNQGSSTDGLRRAAECIQAGIIGQAREVHVWTNRPIWPQGMGRPEGEDPVPASLDWDVWLGPAPLRPFKKGVYHPFNWRGWQDFGTGALGDMACHTVNMPFRALHLGFPTEIEAESLEPMNKESYPLGSKIRFAFPARNTPATVSSSDAQKGATQFMPHRVVAELSPVTLWWYDGGRPDPSAPHGHDFSNKPPAELLTDIEDLLGKVPNSACLILGDRGKIFSPDDYGEQFFLKLNSEQKLVHYKKHPAVEQIPQTIPRNPFKGTADERQHLEWLDAIKRGKPNLCYSRFDIAALLTEIMLLGCVSLRAGRKIEWDGPNMRALNTPEAAPFIKRENRAGWELA